MVDVIGIGGIYMDVISYVSRTVDFGECLMFSKYVTSCGGKGANQIVAAARLGASAAMFGKVGNDVFGQICLQGMADSNVNTDHVIKTSEGQTGLCSILVNSEGQNTIYFSNGANHLVTTEDVMSAAPLIAKSKVMLCNMGLGQPSVMAAMELAKQHGVTTILTPDAATSSDPVHPDLMRHADIICPNQYEASMVTGLPVSGEGEDTRAALTALLERGPKHVIITLGKDGAVLASRDQPQPNHIPAKIVDAVDTTGAGDVFAGSLAFYIAHSPQLSLEEKIRRAISIATISVQKEGTQDSFPWKSQLPPELFAS